LVEGRAPAYFLCFVKPVTWIDGDVSPENSSRLR
jgi:hypothetical protein